MRDVPVKPPSSYVLLTKLFLRQFLENDLLSPDGDRSQTLAVAGASMISLSLFISMFMSAPYAMSVLEPGHAAILTLNDKFFYCALAMLVTALTASAQWDALSLDQRDAAILQPLPVRTSTLRLAKISAVGIFGAGVALAVNLFPTWIFPWMLAFSLPQMTAAQLFGMMMAHATITVSAAVFGFLVVIAIRETASAVLGPSRFVRVSPSLQTAMLLTLGVLLLVLPVSTSRTAERGFSGWRLALPPTAFVGAYEQLTGGFIDELPRRRMTKIQMTRDQRQSARYQERRSSFPVLARRAELLLLAAVAVVVIATGLNALRGFAPGHVAPSRRRRSPLAGFTLRLFPKSAAARAGFDFAMATLWRSKSHRLSLACAAAIGLAAVLVSLSGVNWASQHVSVRLLSIQPLLVGCLLVGFRHVIRVPAELRANWGVEMAWRGRVRSFTSGVQFAAFLTLALPAIAAAVPPVALVGGLPSALAHAFVGVLGAAILLEALMLSYEKVPFSCTYLPAENMKALGPLYAGMFLAGATLFARLQLSIITGERTVSGVVGLFILLVGLRIASARRRVAAVEFNEAPATYQQLGLHR